MAVKIEQNTDLLYRDIRELKEQAAAFRKAADAMYLSVRKLDACWDGPANEAFKAAFQEDYEYCMAFWRFLSSMLSSYENAGGEYDRCEREIADLIRQIRL